MPTTTLFDHRESVRALESRLIKALTLARLSGDALLTHDGRFRLKKLLGRGASGVVCAADDTKMVRELALKLYPGLPDDRLAEGVRAEARALARLSHTNVVTVYDFDASILRPGEIQCFYVSMELLRGPSLRRWLASGPPTARIIDMFCRAGDGLAAAHAAGLIHRDVKPENVMLKGEEPKIVDFGLALDVIVPPRLAPDAQQRSIVGTLAYMAPEALEGRADARSDVFSFAAALWEACYGEFPYPIDTLDPTERRRIIPPRRRDSLPERLYACLLHALWGDPRERTGTIRALVDELRALCPDVEAMTLASAPASVRAPIALTESPAPLPLPSDAKGTTPLLAFALAGLAVAAAGLWSAGFWQTSDDNADQLVDTTPELEPAPAPVAAPTPAATPLISTPCPQAQPFVGAWALESVATQDSKPEGVGIKAHYLLDVHLDPSSCRLSADLEKTRMGGRDLSHDPPRAATIPGSITTEGGVIALMIPQIQLKQRDRGAPVGTYSFSLVTRGRELRGKFTARGDRRAWSGDLTGTAR